jgi:hypothetical protein
MSGREMVPEQKPETFSPEEGQNVKIVCALSSTAYELKANNIKSNYSRCLQRLLSTLQTSYLQVIELKTF